MKTRKFCLFCGLEHKTKRPMLCSVKGEVMLGWSRGVSANEYWRLLRAIANGDVDLEGTALAIIAKRRQRV